MTSIIPLCPPHPSLLEQLRGRKIAIRVESIEAIRAALVLHQQHATHLQCLIVMSRVPVADLNFPQEHWGLPLAIFAPKLGRFRTLIQKFQMRKHLNARIYLPLDCEENFSGLRILSSLGVASAAVFRNGHNDWERVSDLMTYALMGRVQRAPIGPFNYLAERYSPNSRNDFSALYFNDPTRYVHIDEDGRIALSSQELADRQFLSTHVTDLDSLQENTEYRERLESWRRFFLQPQECAFCEAWRICLGKFSECHQENGGCSGFFKDFLKTVELYQSLKMKKVELWQP